MTKNRIQMPYLDKKGKRIDGKRIFNYRQWLERFKQYTRRKYNIGIGPLIKYETIIEIEWSTKEEMIQQEFL